MLKNSYIPSQAMRSWEADALPHAIGALDNDGWAVTIADTPNYVSFGPYVSDIPTGDHVGIWKMMVDDNTNDNFDIVRIDVNDATVGQILATRTVKRS
ncbi:hypothetical protein [Asticcacaulis sp. 201]|uniref:hypothetical protein n=1 Tax=Asticcacaulis sp. 201 TaxID=3028787 RepID=UPI002916BB07|nr:hypothetical protein [Asticcacaulis sp. 201]MDV6331301.1 hypothetical protein [Asticcacaulis sp. 201]